MKMNPAKCAFDVDFGKFSSFILSKREIEAKTKKINVIINMSSPWNIGETQRLASRVVALNRFVSKSIEKCLPFFKVLHKVHF